MKNAITVIDQELIYDVKVTMNANDDACDRAKISNGTLKELVMMCEDLIEINAEITKREQKYKSIIKMFRDNPSHISSELMVNVISLIDNLKGEQ